MEVITNPGQMQTLMLSLKKQGKKIGFVPTMGYLHEGHLSLIRCSKKENDITVVSIFVNPIQFGANEDFGRYPRDFERDKSLCEKENVDYIFYPSYEEMYPDGFQTYVEVAELSKGLCGDFRPGHFKGVATVVAKLFNIVCPDNVYFGKKDFQQLKVIQRMVKDLNFPVNVVGCPVVREPDGLAMSSRNKYLSDEERESALNISKALFEAKRMFEDGITDPNLIKERVRQIISQAKHLKEIQYVEIVDSNTLKPVDKVKKSDVLAVAVYIGNTRLIDNIEF
ncbi:MAG TPA: pantoate--beta-alanine ligase [Sulfurihydrogenibium sp.]|uniref:Pantothenate synthetase n=1 Tax=Sulfurihydrogenibium sp. (strain YO3AOP1) TaxID=436114 RepID=PANC_SULSY|nr:pantoate--beta-alanine ligase [Sulfurihydrogenibium sp. YO3AOP1]B2V652.1 RecName: Full=Pantothenate synthetase; Short=PS; AltName: Full=Pantoate--beta-alanine ligase; AltName: Full=Pantoate-activating enzyme [Sulfurihydrogenibium sp. YO3AOP1]ACD67125.1 pantoate/beta-alanine ligase [Sulfurihydrogenibium sp. YO3AOP1]HBT98305.1 pantoate--beta-alanine ligase [Sulfurihydrogenibium sp.]